MRDGVVKAGATFFGIGYLPWCPGTWAAVGGIGLYFLLSFAPSVLYIVTMAVLLGIGFMVCSPAEKILGKKDSSCIVIDEVATMIAVLFFVPQNIFSIVVAFVLFRLIDIVKPYPIKKIEQFSGSWGIMGDDLIAGVYTVFLTWLIFIVMGR